MHHFNKEDLIRIDKEPHPQKGRGFLVVMGDAVVRENVFKISIFFSIILHRFSYKYSILLISAVSPFNAD